MTTHLTAKVLAAKVAELFVECVFQLGEIVVGYVDGSSRPLWSWRKAAPSLLNLIVRSTAKPESFLLLRLFV
jgi:hypothetical protein